MSKDTDYVATLIEFTVSEDNERVDLEACLEVSDRANATKAECLEAIKMITKCLGKSNPKVILNTLSLLETMCKNCNMRFLYELNNKKLVDALLKVLTRRRDRAKYGNKTSKSSSQQKVEAEDRILYLFQLWADTFMMHQAEFRNIHDAYRALRKDGVQFPERDPSEKFMINFQGQTSPIFLAMEDNITVPANNQGGPVPDKRRGQQSFKPRTTEYKHEQPQSQVQNTLYDENDEDYDYSAYDGIQITQDEVKILDESMGILREIERNATKPADMKGDIAKEILSDLVHVHKRLKRFLKTEKFASASHKNEAIKLNQALSACLSSYKTKYYKLKEDTRRIRTEPDEEIGGRYEYNEDYGTESKNNNRMNTDFGEPSVGAYTDRIRPSNDTGFDPKKKAQIPVRKANISNNKIEPPTGWQPPSNAERNERNQHLGGNPDLIDLLNTRDAGPKPTTKAPKNKVEEKKEEAPKPKPTQDLYDLLDINFSTEPTQPHKAQNNTANVVGNRQQQFQAQQKLDQVSANQFHTAPNEPSNDPFDFINFDSGAKPQAANSGQKQKAAFPQINFLTSPKGKSPTLPTSSNTNNLMAAKVESNEDDDFFSDIANRKK